MALLLGATLLTSGLAAEDAPWHFSLDPPTLESPPDSNPISEGLNLAIAAYRLNKTDTTVARCLFDVSCSHFAEQAVQELGPVAGLVVFIDRYFYRENAVARELYPLKSDAHGVYHLDDSYFVP